MNLLPGIRKEVPQRQRVQPGGTLKLCPAASTVPALFGEPGLSCFPRKGDAAGTSWDTVGSSDLAHDPASKCLVLFPQGAQDQTLKSSTSTSEVRFFPLSGISYEQVQNLNS